MFLIIIYFYLNLQNLKYPFCILKNINSSQYSYAHSLLEFYMGVFLIKINLAIVYFLYSKVMFETH